MVKHTQTICRQQPTNCLSVFDHFVGLGLKRWNPTICLSYQQTGNSYFNFLPPNFTPKAEKLVFCQYMWCLSHTHKRRISPLKIFNQSWKGLKLIKKFICFSKNHTIYGKNHTIYEHPRGEATNEFILHITI